MQRCPGLNCSSQLKQNSLERLSTCSAEDKRLTLLGKVEGTGPNKEGAGGVGVDCNCVIGSSMVGTGEQLPCKVIAFS